MPKHKCLTEEEKNFIRENSARISAREIAFVINRSHAGVKSFIYRERLATPSRRRIFTQQEIETIAREYPTGDTEALAEKLGATVPQIYNAALNRGIHKTEEFKREQLQRAAKNLAESGKAHRFQKGEKPWNTNKKIGLRGRSGETTFKKGSRPPNTAKIGDIAPIKGGYLKIKVAEPNKWKLLHRMRWEEANGPIPKGHALEFLDGDVTNCELSNLRLISRVELMARNTIHNLPEDLKSTIQALGTLRRKLNRHAKKQDHGSSQPSV